MLKDSPYGYGLITIVLHWLTAILIIALFSLGLYMTGLDYYSPWYHKAPALHVSLGLLLVFLMILRTLWRTGNQNPASLPSIDASTMRLANLVKVLLYILVFTIGITGYLIVTAEGQAANFFDLLAVPASLQLNSDNVDLAGEIHKYCAWALIAIAILHGAAALFHHFVKKDLTLLRMLKPVKKNAN